MIQRMFFKTLFNVMARHHSEVSEPLLKSVLAKSERLDVANDQDLLTPAEKAARRVWEARRDKLAALEGRIIAGIFVARDLSIHGDVVE